MNDDYILAKEIVNERFDIEERQYPLFFLCVYGLLRKFKKYKNLVKEVFLETTILIGNKSIGEILLENGMNPEDFFGFDEDEENNNITQGVSTAGNNFVLIDGEQFVNEKIDPLIVCSTINADNTILLMTLIHEFAHLIKGKINTTYLTYDDDYFGYLIRTGLSIYEFRYYPTTNTYSEEVSYSIFDEVINCLQTTDICQEILELEGISTEENIQSFFRTINKNNFISDMSYESATTSLHSLWENTTFRNLIENNILEGNIETIIESFDKILGESSFDLLDDLLLTIDDLDIDNKNESLEMQEAVGKVLKLTNSFNDKTKSIRKIK